MVSGVWAAAEMAADMQSQAVMRSLFAASVLFVSACGPMEDVGPVDDERGTSELGLSLSAADAALVVAFVNYPGTSQGVLDNDVQLDARAAKAIVARRTGPDGYELNADDQPFVSVADLDGVSYVGDVAIDRILRFAKAHPLPPSVTVENVVFTGWQAEAVLWGANTVPVGVLNGLLDNRAAANVIAARPLKNLQALAAVPLIGANALGGMRGQAKVWWRAWKSGGAGPVEPTPVALAGTFDGVAFDEATAQKALQLANASSRETMVAAGVPAAPAAVIAGNRPFTTVAQIAALSGIGSATMLAIHTWASPPAVDPVAQLKGTLEPLTQGLWMTSETDAKLLFVSAPDTGTAPITEALIRAKLTAQHDALFAQVMWVDAADLPLATRTVVEQRDAMTFLNRIIDSADPNDPDALEQAQRFAALRDALGAQLTGLVVFRFGTVNISTFIVGRTANGALAGLLTGQVET